MSSQAHRTRLSFQYKLHILMFISEKLQCEFNFRHNFRFNFFLLYFLPKIKKTIALPSSSFVQYACNESVCMCILGEYNHLELCNEQLYLR